MKKSKLRDGVEVKISEDFIQVVKDVLECFQGNVMKTKFWLTTNNLNFGGISPLKLMAIGRTHKVQEFINAAKESWPTPREWDAEYESDAYTVSLKNGPDVRLGEKIRVREVLSEKSSLTIDQSGDETTKQEGPST